MSDSTHLLIQDVADSTRLDDIKLRGFALPVGCYRLNGLRGSDAAQEAMTRVGRHVAVNIPDRRHIREAIAELRTIEEELERYIPAE